MKKLSRRKKVLYGCATACLGLVFLEGVLRLVWIGVDVAREWRQREAPNSERPARRADFKIDDELGWVSIPGLKLNNHFGEGINLTINSQGARSLREYALPKPEGSYRIVCLGDSFVFGEKVDDADCFTAVMEQADARIEAINLGVSGYSMGQMWMRYQRDAMRFDPDLILVMPIWHDVERLANGIPNLENSDSSLRASGSEIEIPTWMMGRIEGLPVKHAKKGVWGKAHEMLRQSATARMIAKGVPSRNESGAHLVSETYAEYLRVSCTLLADLNRKARETNREFAVALIPTLPDLLEGESQEAYKFVEREFRRAAEREGFPFLSLRESFAARSAIEWKELYLPLELDLSQHCTARGNRLIAEEIHRWLIDSVPRYAEKMARANPTNETPHAPSENP